MPDLGKSFAHDLKSVLHKLRDTLNSPLGPALLAAAIELRSEDNEYPRAYFDRRLEQLQPMFDAAIARGELPADVDCEAVFSLAAGAIYFRIFIASRQVADAFIDDLVEKICWLHCTQAS